MDLLYSQANVRQAIGRENFDNFSYNYYSDDYIDETVHMTPLENIHCVVAGAKKFIAEFDTAPGNLLIYGNTGVGKTFLTNCIARELIMTGHTVIYLTAFELFDILERRKFSRPDNGEDEEYSEAANQFAHIRDCDLLIIDDLGTELNNAFISSQLYQCINERLLGRKAQIVKNAYPGGGYCHFFRNFYRAEMTYYFPDKRLVGYVNESFLRIRISSPTIFRNV